VVAATRAAGDADGAPGRVYNVGGGSRVSLMRTLDVLEAVSGSALDVRCESREHGDVADTGADITRARKELGFAPRTSLEAGLQAEYEWIAENEPRVRRRFERTRPTLAGRRSG
jgi:UDP-glucose 4-epimerase